MRPLIRLPWTGDGMNINEQPLRALLHSREGPVGRIVERRAQEITAAAQRNAATIMHRQPSVVSAISYQMVSGTEAVVGVRDEGPITMYLAAKAVREGEHGVAALCGDRGLGLDGGLGGLGRRDGPSADARSYLPGVRHRRSSRWGRQGCSDQFC